MNNASLEGVNLEGAYLEGANLEGVTLAGAYLAGAYLAGAYLAGARYLTVEQIKTATNWEEAKYDPKFRALLGLPPETPATES